MKNTLKETYIKYCTNYFLDDIVNMKNLDPNKMKVDGKSCKNVFIRYIVYVKVKDFSYTSLNPFYLTFNKINGFIEKSNRKKNI